MSDHISKTPADNSDDLSRLYRAAPTAEPPAPLDAAIRAAARRELAAAIDSKPRFWHRWGTSLASAALLVLAVGVILQLQRETPTALTSAPAPERTATPQPATPEPELALEIAAPATKADTAVMATDAVVKQELRRRAVRDDAVADYQAQPGPKLSVEGKTANADRSRASVLSQGVIEERMSTAPAAATAAPGPIPQPQAIIPLDGRSALQRSEVKQKAATAEHDAITEFSAQSDRSASAEREPEPEPAASMTRKFARESAPDRPTPMSPATGAADLDARTAVIDDWLRRIEALLQARKLPQAEQQLRAFHQQYADYPLPKLQQRFGRQWVDDTLKPPSQ